MESRKKLKENIEEKWRDIAGYEGLYQVSNKGNIRSISHYASNNVNGGVRYTNGRILRQFKMPNGYMQVQFSKNETGIERHKISAAIAQSTECGGFHWRLL